MFENIKNKSLYFKLGTLFFIVITFVLVIQITYNHVSTKNLLIQTINDNIKVSTLQIKNSITPFIESYQVTEYEELIKHEMEYKNLQAIIIEDFFTGKILGQKSFLTGIYRNLNDEFTLIDSENYKKISDNFNKDFSIETNLHNKENVLIGKLTIYGTDYYVKQKLENIHTKSLLINLIIYTLLVAAIYLIIKRTIIKPIENIISSLSYKEGEDIVFKKIEENSSKEFIFLSDSINKMTNQIRLFHKNLKESELRWKFAVDGRGDGLWDWNVKTNEVYFSPKWKSMLGFKEDEIEASLDEWKNRVHPEDLEKVYEDINKHMDGITKVYSNEHRVKCKDSTYKWIHDRGIVVQKDENGEAIRLIGTHTDITTRKENEFKMQQALAVYENTTEGIVITNSKNEIIDVNPSFCKTTGYSLDEIIGKNPSILKSNTTDNELYKNMWKELVNNGSWQGEIINKRKNGEIYEEYLSINTIKNSDGSINSFIGIFSDISILKQQEKMILQQSRTSAIGEMIGNIAHQWRQPLSAISTAATGLKLQLEMGMDVKRVDELDTLDKINEQTQHLSRTIEDFRGFFRDDISIEIETEISKIMSKVNDLTKDSFKINFVQMNFDIEKNVYINVNQNLLIQALLNIYNNALDALKERNHKRVIFISAEKEEDSVKIKIKDNAGGIPKQYMEKIFDPYFTTKHQSQGTGIGLYMTHQIIVKQLKGTITVENVEYDYNSEKYTGAEFTITLK